MTGTHWYRDAAADEEASAIVREAELAYTSPGWQRRLRSEPPSDQPANPQTPGLHLPDEAVNEEAFAIICGLDFRPPALNIATSSGRRYGCRSHRGSTGGEHNNSTP